MIERKDASTARVFGEFAAVGRTEPAEERQPEVVVEPVAREAEEKRIESALGVVVRGERGHGFEFTASCGKDCLRAAPSLTTTRNHHFGVSFMTVPSSLAV